MAEPVAFSVRMLNEDKVLLEFSLSRPIKPEDLRGLKLPEIPLGKVLLISGRGPIWLYGFLIHHYVHLAKAVAVFDPKIPGYVIVASHDPQYEEGDVIQA